VGIKEYRQKNRKDVTAPSGSVFTVRKLNTQDFYDLLGTIPGVRYLLDKRAGKDVPVEVNHEMEKAAQLVMILRGPVAVDGETVVMTEAKTEDCKDGEMSLSDLSEADYGFLLNEVTEFYNPTTKPVDGRTHEGARFPGEERKDGGDNPLPG
jgi:hypothetical protein